jgi:hypothetical protein
MPAGNTYEAIATQTLGSAAASVTFSSIPGTYTDLVIVVNGTNTANNNLNTQFNGDTGTNYSRTIMYGAAGTAVSARDTSATGIALTYFEGRTMSVYSIMNYANTTTYKTALSRTNAPVIAVTAVVGLWRSTAAINSITLTSVAGTMDIGTTLSIYGIKAA